MQKLNAHFQNEADMSLWLWGWISFEGIVGTKLGRWGLAVEFPVGTGSFKTQIKQGGNAQRMNMNWCWALPGLASFDKAHFLIACQLFTLFKYVSSDEHASPETDPQMHTETHPCSRAGGKESHTSLWGRWWMDTPVLSELWGTGTPLPSLWCIPCTAPAEESALLRIIWMQALLNAMGMSAPGRSPAPHWCLC